MPRPTLLLLACLLHATAAASSCFSCFDELQLLVRTRPHSTQNVCIENGELFLQQVNRCQLVCEPQRDATVLAAIQDLISLVDTKLVCQQGTSAQCTQCARQKLEGFNPTVYANTYIPTVSPTAAVPGVAPTSIPFSPRCSGLRNTMDRLVSECVSSCDGYPHALIQLSSALQEKAQMPQYCGDIPHQANCAACVDQTRERAKTYVGTLPSNGVNCTEYNTTLAEFGGACTNTFCEASAPALASLFEDLDRPRGGCPAPLEDTCALCVADKLLTPTCAALDEILNPSARTCADVCSEGAIELLQLHTVATELSQSFQCNEDTCQSCLDSALDPWQNFNVSGLTVSSQVIDKLCNDMQLQTMVVFGRCEQSLCSNRPQLVAEAKQTFNVYNENSGCTLNQSCANCTSSVSFVPDPASLVPQVNCPKLQDQAAQILATSCANECTPQDPNHVFLVSNVTSVLRENGCAGPDDSVCRGCLASIRVTPSDYVDPTTMQTDCARLASAVSAAQQQCVGVCAIDNPLLAQIVSSLQALVCDGNTGEQLACTTCISEVRKTFNVQDYRTGGADQCTSLTDAVSDAKEQCSQLCQANAQPWVEFVDYLDGSFAASGCGITMATFRCSECLLEVRQNFTAALDNTTGLLDCSAADAFAQDAQSTCQERCTSLVMINALVQDTNALKCQPDRDCAACVLEVQSNFTMDELLYANNGSVNCDLLTAEVADLRTSCDDVCQIRDPAYISLTRRLDNVSCTELNPQYFACNTQVRENWVQLVAEQTPGLGNCTRLGQIKQRAFAPPACDVSTDFEVATFGSELDNYSKLKGCAQGQDQEVAYGCVGCLSTLMDSFNPWDYVSAAGEVNCTTLNSAVETTKTACSGTCTLQDAGYVEFQNAVDKLTCGEDTCGSCIATARSAFDAIDPPNGNVECSLLENAIQTARQSCVAVCPASNPSYQSFLQYLVSKSCDDETCPECIARARTTFDAAIATSPGQTLSCPVLQSAMATAAASCPNACGATDSARRAFLEYVASIQCDDGSGGGPEACATCTKYWQETYEWDSSMLSSGLPNCRDIAQAGSYARMSCDDKCVADPQMLAQLKEFVASLLADRECTAAGTSNDLSCESCVRLFEFGYDTRAGLTSSCSELTNFAARAGVTCGAPVCGAGQEAVLTQLQNRLSAKLQSSGCDGTIENETCNACVRLAPRRINYEPFVDADTGVMNCPGVKAAADAVVAQCAPSCDADDGKFEDLVDDMEDAVEVAGCKKDGTGFDEDTCKGCVNNAITTLNPTQFVDDATKKMKCDLLDDAMDDALDDCEDVCWRVSNDYRRLQRAFRAVETEYSCSNGQSIVPSSDECRTCTRNIQRNFCVAKYFEPGTRRVDCAELALGVELALGGCSDECNEDEPVYVAVKASLDRVLDMYDCEDAAIDPDNGGNSGGGVQIPTCVSCLITQQQPVPGMIQSLVQNTITKDEFCVKMDEVQTALNATCAEPCADYSKTMAATSFTLSSLAKRVGQCSTTETGTPVSTSSCFSCVRTTFGEYKVLRNSMNNGEIGGEDVCTLAEPIYDKFANMCDLGSTCDSFSRTKERYQRMVARSVQQYNCNLDENVGNGGVIVPGNGTLSRTCNTVINNVKKDIITSVRNFKNGGINKAAFCVAMQGTVNDLRSQTSGADCSQYQRRVSNIQRLAILFATRTKNAECVLQEPTTVSTQAAPGAADNEVANAVYDTDPVWALSGQDSGEQAMFFNNDPIDRFEVLRSMVAELGTSVVSESQSSATSACETSDADAKIELCVSANVSAVDVATGDCEELVAVKAVMDGCVQSVCNTECVMDAEEFKLLVNATGVVDATDLDLCPFIGQEASCSDGRNPGEGGGTVGGGESGGGGSGGGESGGGESGGGSGPVSSGSTSAGSTSGGTVALVAGIAVAAVGAVVLLVVGVVVVRRQGGIGRGREPTMAERVSFEAQVQGKDMLVPQGVMVSDNPLMRVESGNELTGVETGNELMRLESGKESMMLESDNPLMTMESDNPLADSQDGSHGVAPSNPNFNMYDL